MTKTFSTKLDAKVLRLLEDFCQRYHLKKSRLIEEIITEGIQKKSEALELAHSLERGLEQEAAGDLHSLDDVEKAVFGKKKTG